MYLLTNQTPPIHRNSVISSISTRFAPSPTGELHLGHAYAALFASNLASELGGRFLVRIEDIDLGRSRPEYETALLADLEWLGLRWQLPVRRQSDHFLDYKAAMDRLAEFLYPCFCTRKEIQAEIQAAGNAPQGPDGPLYPGTCQSLPKSEAADRMAAGAPYALRLNVAAATLAAGPELVWQDLGHGSFVAEPGLFGDVILARKDTPVSYHLAVVVDDALQGISHVTRGEDLLPATHLHRLLQALLGLPTPLYHHHRLITDGDGKRLAKRDQATSLRSLRAQGCTPEQIFKAVGL
jgi:glutamyl-Q tRNA(Asp) synthetase